VRLDGARAPDPVREIPTPAAGCGYVITRYGEAKPVVLTPEDFEEMRRASRMRSPATPDMM